MDVLIGVDEAGYGPNYGPLAVAATAWRIGGEERGARSEESEGASSGRRAGERARAVASRSLEDAPAAVAPKTPCDVDLYKLLRKAVGRAPDKAGRKLAIADSKVLYSPQVGLRQLERGVLAALGALRAKPRSDAPIASGDQSGGVAPCIARFLELLELTEADGERRRHEVPCHADDELALPVAELGENVQRLAAALLAACGAAGVGLVAIRARLVYPAEFNALVERWGSKGAALSHVTMGLVRGVVDGVLGVQNAAGVRISFDKHGGRNRYAALLQHHFPDSWIDPVSEHRHRSHYRWEHAGTPVEAEFRVGCEELLPTALASMTAKYHRELAMRAFNAFWTARVPGLRPTAGYPGDAARFRADIAAVQAELGFAEAAIWRCR
jgi:hypothetical protein